MTDLTYDPNTCPDPAAMLPGLVTAIMDRLCAEGDASRKYTDAEISIVMDALSSLENTVNGVVSADLQAQLTVLSDLVKTLDLDSDGAVVNDLLAIRASAEAAAASAKEAGDAAKAAQSAAQTAQSAAQTAQKTASDAAAQASQNKSAIDGLAEQVAAWEDTDTQIDPEQVRAIANEQVCANNRRWASALTAAIESVNSHVCTYTPKESAGEAEPAEDTGGIG